MDKFWVGICFALGLVGCSAADGAPEDSVEATQDTLTVLRGDGWSQGQPAKDLGSAYDRFCFLQGVTGKFEGGGESVRVNIVGGRWVASGTSSQTGVAAYAQCVLITNPDWTQEFAWAAGSTPIEMGPASDRVCFLTGVAGKFAGAGESVRVQIYGEGSPTARYQLTGTSSQPGVLGRARCIRNYTRYGQEFHWTQGSPQTVMYPPAWACGLTRMKGRFQGSGEFIYTTLGSLGGSSVNILSGTSGQNSVATSAACFH